VGLPAWWRDYRDILEFAEPLTVPLFQTELV
jgi:hypothetical protein